MAARLLELSQSYGLASREMSLVAVVTRSSDRPGELPETRIVPVGLAQDVAVEAYFMYQTMTGMAPAMSTCFISRGTGKGDTVADYALGSSPAKPDGTPSAGLFSRLLRSRKPRAESPAGPPRASETTDDILLDLASRMDSDGGMPGKNREARASATALVLLAFLSQGHTPIRGAFRSHVARLVSFLLALTGLSDHQQQIVNAVIELAHKGPAPAGEWIALASASGNHWKEIESGVLKAQASARS